MVGTARRARPARAAPPGAGAAGARRARADGRRRPGRPRRGARRAGRTPAPRSPTSRRNTATAASWSPRSTTPAAAVCRLSSSPASPNAFFRSGRARTPCCSTRCARSSAPISPPRATASTASGCCCASPSAPPTRGLYLSYPRVDVVQGRPRVTSFYGLDVARATRGAIPDVEAFERDAVALVGARLAWPAPPDAAHAIDAAEHDLATLGRVHRAGRARAERRARSICSSSTRTWRAPCAPATRAGNGRAGPSSTASCAARPTPPPSSPPIASPRGRTHRRRCSTSPPAPIASFSPRSCASNRAARSRRSSSSTR